MEVKGILTRVEPTLLGDTQIGHVIGSINLDLTILFTIENDEERDKVLTECMRLIFSQSRKKIIIEEEFK